MLSEFESSVPMAGKTPHATYCICGVTKEDKYAVLLVSKEELEETKKKYKTLTSIHIYSMEERRPKDASALVITDCKPKNIVSIEPSNMSKSSSTSTTSILKRDDKPKTFEKDKIEKKDPISTKKKRTSNERKSINKIIKNKKANNNTSITSLLQNPISHKETKQTMKRKSIQDDDGEHENYNLECQEESGIKMELDTKHTEDSSVTNVEMGTEDEKNDTHNLEEESGIEMELDTRHREDSSMTNAEMETEDKRNYTHHLVKSLSILSDGMEIDQEQSQLLSKKQTRPRGRRRVSKKRIYQDAKGFKVSEDTYEWESFSEDECDPRQTGINVTIKSEGSGIKNKRGKKKGDDSSQKSLLNFFGKI
ncbi:14458_t:CDS:2 [Dentiscutata erythropus]|uniref:DNA polymerase delta subunit 3 n=1 Tax=Dentiscutata erythropus TaxID=1348616 RepID=A0A9N9B0Y7_9GLOM|nr:14458_t:CDS:2 [Dentiscutata erythropus]